MGRFSRTVMLCLACAALLAPHSTGTSGATGTRADAAQASARQLRQRLGWTAAQMRAGSRADSTAFAYTLRDSAAIAAIAGDSAVRIRTRDLRLWLGHARGLLAGVLRDSLLVHDKVVRDSLAALRVDSISLYFIHESGLIERDAAHLYLGRSAQGCVMEWVGGSPRIAPEQPPECSGEAPVRPQSLIPSTVLGGRLHGASQ